MHVDTERGEIYVERRICILTLVLEGFIRGHRLSTVNLF